MKKTLLTLAFLGSTLATFQAAAEIKTEHQVGLKAVHSRQELKNSTTSSVANDYGFGVETTFLYTPDEQNQDLYLGVNAGYERIDQEGNDFSFWELSPVIAYNLADNLQVYAKAGFAKWEVDINSAISGVDLIYGVGIMASADSNIYSGLEITSLSGDDGGVDMDDFMASVRVGYKF